MSKWLWNLKQVCVFLLRTEQKEPNQHWHLLSHRSWSNEAREYLQIKPTTYSEAHLSSFSIFEEHTSLSPRNKDFQQPRAILINTTCGWTEMPKAVSSSLVNINLAVAPQYGLGPGVQCWEILFPVSILPSHVRTSLFDCEVFIRATTVISVSVFFGLWGEIKKESS